jgi:hypothetical protein
MRKHLWAVQWIAALMSAGGIGVELSTGADLGYVLITSGAVLFAIITKLGRVSE